MPEADINYQGALEAVVQSIELGREKDRILRELRDTLVCEALLRGDISRADVARWAKLSNAWVTRIERYGPRRSHV